MILAYNSGMFVEMEHTRLANRVLHVAVLLILVAYGD